jgi:hypothetical protein
MLYPALSSNPAMRNTGFHVPGPDLDVEEASRSFYLFNPERQSQDRPVSRPLTIFFLGDPDDAVGLGRSSRGQAIERALKKVVDGFEGLQPVRFVEIFNRQGFKRAIYSKFGFPDLLLIHLSYPNACGIISEWRSTPEVAAKGIIMCDAFCDQQILATARELGADGFVEIPASLTALSAPLEDIISWLAPAVTPGFQAEVLSIEGGFSEPQLDLCYAFHMPTDLNRKSKGIAIRIDEQQIVRGIALLTLGMLGLRLFITELGEIVQQALHIVGLWK